MKYLTFILTLFLLIPTQAHALSCASLGIEHSIRNADTIFIGRITQIDSILTNDKVNELTAHVEKAYKGVENGETITIYQHHWINRQEDWSESEGDQKRGLFILSKSPSSNTPMVFLSPKDVYFIGMCGFPYWEASEQHIDIVKKALADNVTDEGDAQN